MINLIAITKAIAEAGGVQAGGLQDILIQKDETVDSWEKLGELVLEPEGAF